jgi:hypothetical protein
VADDDKNKGTMARLKELAKYVYDTSLAPKSTEERVQSKRDYRDKQIAEMSKEDIERHLAMEERIRSAQEWVNTKAKKYGAPILKAEENLARKLIPGDEDAEDAVIYNGIGFPRERKPMAFVRTDPKTGGVVSAELELEPGRQRVPTSIQRPEGTYNIDDEGRYVLDAGDVDIEYDVPDKEKRPKEK